ncbi:MAG: butyrate kinase [Candidatus Marinimicrobia bacterium]|jgi:butyrate kinase|nr:butyrate kinase [Candidatus Neomarinimicrobiota bacterium]MBT3630021.1 butyrate kinase [Candidatus Neomarinimicrobiota bacterium]MBT3825142.1 butyrate kinase [Candidatus Neomarinimicrobiota bacterium]MBT4129304.1 butyrate kinase [Candidatus Neomarinimicrobiota bacterium]MBT4294482.1 butyrate kinase [Candidatus Neomarinimicrobiota bacterium]
MITQGHILIINPGSTSTKLAIYSYDLENELLTLEDETTLVHASLEASISAQLDIRYEDVDHFLMAAQVDLQIIMARGAPLRPLSGGSYQVNDLMLDDLRTNKYSQHASNLAALMGERIGHKNNIPVYITDPITTDEFEAVARISGVPGIERKSRSHALNIKASLRELCIRLNKNYAESSWVVCHMGGGISVATVSNGRIIDVNDALLGMGPFSPERAGALPTSGILDLAFGANHDRSSIEELLSKESGLKGYLGTADLQMVEERIHGGDIEAELIFQAMVYQISKEIAAMASVLKFKLDGILLTGGMANSQLLCESISDRVQALSEVYVEAGENEMEALAQAGLRILTGTESIKTYT